MSNLSGPLKQAGIPPIDAGFVTQWKQTLKDPATKQELAKLLAKVPIFAQTPLAFRNEIVNSLLPVEYHIGQTIFHQGDKGEWMGILLRGRLDRQVVRDRHQGETKIGEVCPGECIGDIGLLGVSKVRTVTCMATMQSTLLVLEKQAFHDAVELAGGAENVSLMQDTQAMQEVMTDFDSFCRLECFKRLDRDFVMALCRHLEPRLVYPKSILMRENNYGNEMYILHVGEVKVEKGGKFIVKLKGGVVLGEVAVLGADKRRTATVTSTSLCLVYVLHGDVFKETLDRFPNSKKIFDHAYISRLVTFELSKVKDERKGLNEFYGNAHPMTTTQLSEQVYGAKPGEDGGLKAILPKQKPGQRGLIAPGSGGPARFCRIGDLALSPGASPRPGKLPSMNQTA